MVMTARIQLGWVDPADLEPETPEGEEGEEGEAADVFEATEGTGA